MAIIDLPGGFLHADLENDDQVLMAMEGRLAELMAVIEPKIHPRFVAKDNDGKKVLYVKLMKALYGLLKSALIFYKKSSEGLLSMGFQLDQCIHIINLESKPGG